MMLQTDTTGNWRVFEVKLWKFIGTIFIDFTCTTFYVNFQLWDTLSKGLPTFHLPLKQNSTKFIKSIQIV